MIETRELRGWWWLPGRREDALPGTLVITRGDAELDLNGHFGHEVISKTEREIHLSGFLAEQPRILGIDSNGRPLTTDGHRSATYHEHTSGVTLSKYGRSVTLIGRHFERGERIEFDEIAVRTSDLAAWTEIRAIETKARSRKHRDGYYVWSDVSARSRQLDDIQIPLSRGERAFIHIGTKFKGIATHSQGSEHAELSQDTQIHLRFARHRSLDYVFARVGDLRNFLSLAVGRPVAVLSVTGYRDDTVDEHTKQPLPIELVWHIPHNPDPPETPRQPHEMLFTLPAISADISKVMRSWFAKQARLEPVFNLFFGLLYDPDIYSDVRFLLYAQAVETYGYRRRRAPIERKFREQIRDVLSICPTASSRIIGQETEAFIELLKLSRDYYTHYNPAKKARAAEGAGLYLLSLQLRTLVEMALLRELGFSNRAVDAILTRARRYERIEHVKMQVADGR